MRGGTAGCWTPARVLTRGAGRSNGGTAGMDGKRVELLAAGMAHNLNNVLTSMMCGSEWALGQLGDHPARAAVELVARSSQETAELVSRLMAYTGIGPFIASEVNLSALAARVVESLRGSIPPNLHLRLDLAACVPMMAADGRRIEQLIRILLDNSIEAIGEGGGAIGIRTGVEPSPAGSGAGQPDSGVFACLEVRDTGCGMDAAEMRRIFEPFFSTKGVGRGLGLAAVSGIVRTHRGSIGVESSPGSGSVFRVRFPAWPPDDWDWAAEEKAA